MRWGGSACNTAGDENGIKSRMLSPTLFLTISPRLYCHLQQVNYGQAKNSDPGRGARELLSSRFSPARQCMIDAH